MIRIVALLAVLGVAAFVFTACSSMAIASWRAIPELRTVVGDHGVVSPSLRKANINVSPSCLLYVDLIEGVSTEDVAGILAGIAPTERFEPCEVNRVRVASKSDVHADDWNTLSPEAWLAVADLLNRPGPISIFLRNDSPALVVTFGEPELFADFAAMVRPLITGAERLDDAIGPIEWRIEWKASTGAYSEVRITTKETPPLALADFLDSVTPVMEQSTVSITVTFVINDGAARTQVEFSEPSEAEAAAISAAFAASGLGGELVFIIPEAASSAS